MEHTEATLPESNTETLTQHLAEVEGLVGTASFDYVGERAESEFVDVVLEVEGRGRKGSGSKKV